MRIDSAHAAMNMKASTTSHIGGLKKLHSPSQSAVFTKV
jgi:hypothetical protein